MSLIYYIRQNMGIRGSGSGQPNPASDSILRPSSNSESHLSSPLQTQARQFIQSSGSPLLSDLRPFAAELRNHEQLSHLAVEDLRLLTQLLERADVRTQRSALWQELALNVYQSLGGHHSALRSEIQSFRTLLLNRLPENSQLRLREMFSREDVLWRRIDRLQEVSNVTATLASQELSQRAMIHHQHLSPEQLRTQVSAIIGRLGSSFQSAESLSAAQAQLSVSQDPEIQRLFGDGVASHQAIQIYLSRVSNLDLSEQEYQSAKLDLARALARESGGFAREVIELGRGLYRMASSALFSSPHPNPLLEERGTIPSPRGEGVPFYGTDEGSTHLLQDRLFQWAVGAEGLLHGDTSAWSRSAEASALNESYLETANQLLRELPRGNAEVRNLLDNELPMLAGERELSEILRTHSIVFSRTKWELSTPVIGAIAAIGGGWLGLLGGRNRLLAAAVGGAANGLIQTVLQLGRQKVEQGSLSPNQPSLKEQLTQSGATGAACGVVGRLVSVIFFKGHNVSFLGQIGERGLREFRWGGLRFVERQAKFWLDVGTEIGCDELYGNRNIQNRLGIRNAPQPPLSLRGGEAISASSVNSAAGTAVEASTLFKWINNAAGELCGDVYGDVGHHGVQAAGIHFDQRIQLERIQTEFAELYERLGVMTPEAHQNLGQFLLSYTGEGGSKEELMQAIERLGDVRTQLLEIQSSLCHSERSEESKLRSFTTLRMTNEDKMDSHFDGNDKALQPLSLQIFFRAIAGNTSLQTVSESIQAQSEQFFATAQFHHVTPQMSQLVLRYFAGIYRSSDQINVLKEAKKIGSRIENLSGQAEIQYSLLRFVLFNSHGPQLNLANTLNQVTATWKSRQKTIQRIITDVENVEAIRDHFAFISLVGVKKVEVEVTQLWKEMKTLFDRSFPPLPTHDPVYRSLTNIPRPSLLQFVKLVFENSQSLTSAQVLLTAIKEGKRVLVFENGVLKFKETKKDRGDSSHQERQDKQQRQEESNPEKGNTEDQVETKRKAAQQQLSTLSAAIKNYKRNIKEDNELLIDEIEILQDEVANLLFILEHENDEAKLAYHLSKIPKIAFHFRFLRNSKAVSEETFKDPKEFIRDCKAALWNHQAISTFIQSEGVEALRDLDKLESEFEKEEIDILKISLVSLQGFAPFVRHKIEFLDSAKDRSEWLELIQAELLLQGDFYDQMSLQLSFLTLPTRTELLEEWKQAAELSRHEQTIHKYHHSLERDKIEQASFDAFLESRFANISPLLFWKYPNLWGSVYLDCFHLSRKIKKEELRFLKEYLFHFDISLIPPTELHNDLVQDNLRQLKEVIKFGKVENFADFEKITPQFLDTLIQNAFPSGTNLESVQSVILKYIPHAKGQKDKVQGFIAVDPDNFEGDDNYARIHLKRRPDGKWEIYHCTHHARDFAKHIRFSPAVSSEYLIVPSDAWMGLKDFTVNDFCNAQVHQIEDFFAQAARRISSHPHSSTIPQIELQFVSKEGASHFYGVQGLPYGEANPARTMGKVVLSRASEAGLYHISNPRGTGAKVVLEALTLTGFIFKAEVHEGLHPAKAVEEIFSYSAYLPLLHQKLEGLETDQTHLEEAKQKLLTRYFEVQVALSRSKNETEKLYWEEQINKLAFEYELLLQFKEVNEQQTQDPQQIKDAFKRVVQKISENDSSLKFHNLSVLKGFYPALREVLNNQTSATSQSQLAQVFRLALQSDTPFSQLLTNSQESELFSVDHIIFELVFVQNLSQLNARRMLPANQAKEHHESLNQLISEEFVNLPFDLFWKYPALWRNLFLDCFNQSDIFTAQSLEKLRTALAKLDLKTIPAVALEEGLVKDNVAVLQRIIGGRATSTAFASTSLVDDFNSGLTHFERSDSPDPNQKFLDKLDERPSLTFSKVLVQRTADQKAALIQALKNVEKLASANYWNVYRDALNELAEITPRLAEGDRLIGALKVIDHLLRKDQHWLVINSAWGSLTVIIPSLKEEDRLVIAHRAEECLGYSLVHYKTALIILKELTPQLAERDRIGRALKVAESLCFEDSDIRNLALKTLKEIIPSVVEKDHSALAIKVIGYLGDRRGYVRTLAEDVLEMIKPKLNAGVPSLALHTIKILKNKGVDSSIRQEVAIALREIIPHLIKEKEDDFIVLALKLEELLGDEGVNASAVKALRAVMLLEIILKSNGGELGKLDESQLDRYFQIVLCAQDKNEEINKQLFQNFKFFQNAGLWEKFTSSRWVQSLGLPQVLLNLIHQKLVMEKGRLLTSRDRWKTLLAYLSNLNPQRIEILHLLLSAQGKSRDIFSALALLNSLPEGYTSKFEKHILHKLSARPATASSGKGNESRATFLKNEIAEFLKLKLSSRLGDVACLNNAKFMNHLSETGLLALFARAAAFMSDAGCASLVRLMQQLSECDIENGKLIFKQRYEELLEMGFDAELVERWSKEYHKPFEVTLVEDVESVKRQQIAQALRQLSIHSGEVTEETGALARQVNEFKVELEKGNCDLAQLNNLFEVFEKKYQSIREKYGDQFANIRQDLMNLRNGLKQAERIKEGDEIRQSFTVTGSAEQMAFAGSIPNDTCQRLTALWGASTNKEGQPLHKMIHGQFKLANWRINGEVAARYYLEITRNLEGETCLLVHTLYASGTFSSGKQFEDELLAYASSLGITNERVYFADKVGENAPLPLACGDIIYRDTWYDEVDPETIPPRNKDLTGQKINNDVSASLLFEANEQTIQALQTLGSDEKSEDEIHQTLLRLLEEQSAEQVLLSVGRILRKNAQGAWPSYAFARAWIRLKRDHIRLDYSQLFDRFENDLEMELALSFAVPECVTPERRALIDQRIQALGGNENIIVEEQAISSALTASYLSDTTPVPWREVPVAEMAENVQGVLQLNWRSLTDENYRFGTDAAYYEPCNAYNDLSDNLFSKYFYFAGWNPVYPSQALRLNVEIPIDESERQRCFERVSKMFALLLLKGHKVSAKFTTSDAKDHPLLSGKRFCIYVPTAAVHPTLAAFKEAGFLEEQIDPTQEVHLIHESATALKLPGRAGLRTTNESHGFSSRVQKKEAKAAVRALGIPCVDVNESLGSAQYVVESASKRHSYAFGMLPALAGLAHFNGSSLTSSILPFALGVAMAIAINWRSLVERIRAYFSNIKEIQPNAFLSELSEQEYKAVKQRGVFLRAELYQRMSALALDQQEGPISFFVYFDAQGEFIGESNPLIQLPCEIQYEEGRFKLAEKDAAIVRNLILKRNLSEALFQTCWALLSLEEMQDASSHFKSLEKLRRVPDSEIYPKLLSELSSISEGPSVLDACLAYLTVIKERLWLRLDPEMKTREFWVNLVALFMKKFPEQKKLQADLLIALWERGDADTKAWTEAFLVEHHSILFEFWKSIPREENPLLKAKLRYELVGDISALKRIAELAGGIGEEFDEIRSERENLFTEDSIGNPNAARQMRSLDEWSQRLKLEALDILFRFSDAKVLQYLRDLSSRKDLNADYLRLVDRILSNSNKRNLDSDNPANLSSVEIDAEENITIAEDENAELERRQSALENLKYTQDPKAREVLEYYTGQANESLALSAVQALGYIPAQAANYWIEVLSSGRSSRRDLIFSILRYGDSSLLPLLLPLLDQEQNPANRLDFKEIFSSLLRSAYALGKENPKVSEPTSVAPPLYSPAFGAMVALGLSGQQISGTASVIAGVLMLGAFANVSDLFTKIKRELGEVVDTAKKVVELFKKPKIVIARETPLHNLGESALEVKRVAGVQYEEARKSAAVILHRAFAKAEPGVSRKLFLDIPLKKIISPREMDWENFADAMYGVRKIRDFFAFYKTLVVEVNEAYELQFSQATIQELEIAFQQAASVQDKAFYLGILESVSGMRVVAAEERLGKTTERLYYYISQLKQALDYEEHSLIAIYSEELLDLLRGDVRFNYDMNDDADLRLLQLILHPTFKKPAYKNIYDDLLCVLRCRPDIFTHPQNSALFEKLFRDRYPKINPALFERINNQNGISNVDPATQWELGNLKEVIDVLKGVFTAPVETQEVWSASYALVRRGYAAWVSRQINRYLEGENKDAFKNFNEVQLQRFADLFSDKAKAVFTDPFLPISETDVLWGVRTQGISFLKSKKFNFEYAFTISVGVEGFIETQTFSGFINKRNFPSEKEFYIAISNLDIPSYAKYTEFLLLLAACMSEYPDLRAQTEAFLDRLFERLSGIDCLQVLELRDHLGFSISPEYISRKLDSSNLPIYQRLAIACYLLKRGQWNDTEVFSNEAVEVLLANNRKFFTEYFDHPDSREFFESFLISFQISNIQNPLFDIILASLVNIGDARSRAVIEKYLEENAGNSNEADIKLLRALNSIRPTAEENESTSDPQKSSSSTSPSAFMFAGLGLFADLPDASRLLSLVQEIPNALLHYGPGALALAATIAGVYHCLKKIPHRFRYAAMAFAAVLAVFSGEAEANSGGSGDSGGGVPNTTQTEFVAAVEDKKKGVRANLTGVGAGPNPRNPKDLELIRLLRSPDLSERESALRGFSLEFGNGSLCRILESLALDSEEEDAIRLYAARSMDKYEEFKRGKFPERTISAFRSLVTSAKADVTSKIALEELAKLRFPALMILLQDRDASVSRSAARSLGYLGFLGFASKALGPFLEDKDPMVRAKTALVLGKFGYPHQASIVLEDLLADNHSDGIRQFAAEALGELGFTSLAHKALMDLLKKGGNNVSRSLVLAFRELGYTSKALLALKTQFNNETDFGIRQQIIELMGELGNPDAREFLEPLLQDKDPSLRIFVIRVLVKLGITAPVLPAVKELLKGDDARLRREATLIWGRLGDIEAKPHLLALIESLNIAFAKESWIEGYNDQQREAAKILFNFGLKDKAREVLESHLYQYQAGPHLKAAKTLAELGFHDHACKALVELLEGSEPRFVIDAAYAIGEFGYTDAATALEPLLQHQNNDVKTAAALALGKLGDLGLARSTFQTMATHKDPRVRKSAAEAFAKFEEKEVFDADAASLTPDSSIIEEPKHRKLAHEIETALGNKRLTPRAGKIGEGKKGTQMGQAWSENFEGFVHLQTGDAIRPGIRMSEDGEFYAPIYRVPEGAPATFVMGEINGIVAGTLAALAYRRGETVGLIRTTKSGPQVIKPGHLRNTAQFLEKAQEGASSGMAPLVETAVLKNIPRGAQIYVVGDFYIGKLEAYSKLIENYRRRGIEVIPVQAVTPQWEVPSYRVSWRGSQASYEVHEAYARGKAKHDSGQKQDKVNAFLKRYGGHQFRESENLPKQVQSIFKQVADPTAPFEELDIHYKVTSSEFVPLSENPLPINFFERMEQVFQDERGAKDFWELVKEAKERGWGEFLTWLKRQQSKLHLMSPSHEFYSDRHVIQADNFMRGKIGEDIPSLAWGPTDETLAKIWRHEHDRRQSSEVPPAAQPSDARTWSQTFQDLRRRLSSSEKDGISVRILGKNILTPQSSAVLQENERAAETTLMRFSGEAGCHYLLTNLGSRFDHPSGAWQDQEGLNLDDFSHGGGRRVKAEIASGVKVETIPLPVGGKLFKQRGTSLEYELPAMASDLPILQSPLHDFQNKAASFYGNNLAMLTQAPALDTLPAEIRALMELIKGLSVGQAIQAIQRYILRHFRYQTYTGLKKDFYQNLQKRAGENALQDYATFHFALQCGGGKCVELSEVTVFLLRLAGIPALKGRGYVVENNSVPSTPHALALAILPDSSGAFHLQAVEAATVYMGTVEAQNLESETLPDIPLPVKEDEKEEEVKQTIALESRAQEPTIEQRWQELWNSANETQKRQISKVWEYYFYLLDHYQNREMMDPEILSALFSQDQFDRYPISCVEEPSFWLQQIRGRGLSPNLKILQRLKSFLKDESFAQASSSPNPSAFMFAGLGLFADLPDASRLINLVQEIPNALLHYGPGALALAAVFTGVYHCLKKTSVFSDSAKTKSEKSTNSNGAVRSSASVETTTAGPNPKTTTITAVNVQVTSTDFAHPLSPALEKVLEELPSGIPAAFKDQARVAAYFMQALEKGETLFTLDGRDLTAAVDRWATIVANCGFTDYGRNPVWGRRPIQYPPWLEAYRLTVQDPLTDEECDKVKNWYLNYLKRRGVTLSERNTYEYADFSVEQGAVQQSNILGANNKFYIERKNLLNFQAIEKSFEELANIKLHPKSLKLSEAEYLVLYFDDLNSEQIETLLNIFKQSDVGVRGPAQDPKTLAWEEGKVIAKIGPTLSNDVSLGQGTSNRHTWQGETYSVDEYFRQWIRLTFRGNKNPADPYKVSFLTTIIEEGENAEDFSKKINEQVQVCALPVLYVRGKGSVDVFNIGRMSHYLAGVEEGDARSRRFDPAASVVAVASAKYFQGKHQITQYFSGEFDVMAAPHEARGIYARHEISRERLVTIEGDKNGGGSGISIRETFFKKLTESGWIPSNIKMLVGFEFSEKFESELQKIYPSVSELLDHFQQVKMRPDEQFDLLHAMLSYSRWKEKENALKTLARLSGLLIALNVDSVVLKEVLQVLSKLRNSEEMEAAFQEGHSVLALLVNEGWQTEEIRRVILIFFRLTETTQECRHKIVDLIRSMGKKKWPPAVQGLILGYPEEKTLAYYELVEGSAALLEKCGWGVPEASNFLALARKKRVLELLSPLLAQMTESGFSATQQQKAFSTAEERVSTGLAIENYELLNSVLQMMNEMKWSANTQTQVFSGLEKGRDVTKNFNALIQFVNCLRRLGWKEQEIGQTFFRDEFQHHYCYYRTDQIRFMLEAMETAQWPLGLQVRFAQVWLRNSGLFGNLSGSEKLHLAISEMKGYLSPQEQCDLLCLYSIGNDYYPAGLEPLKSVLSSFKENGWPPSAFVDFFQDHAKKRQDPLTFNFTELPELMKAFKGMGISVENQVKILSQVHDYTTYVDRYGPMARAIEGLGKANWNNEETCDLIFELLRKIDPSSALLPDFFKYLNSLLEKMQLLEIPKKAQQRFLKILLSMEGYLPGESVKFLAKLVEGLSKNSWTLEDKIRFLESYAIKTKGQIFKHKAWAESVQALVEAGLNSAELLSFFDRFLSIVRIYPTNALKKFGDFLSKTSDLGLKKEQQIELLILTTEAEPQPSKDSYSDASLALKYLVKSGYKVQEAYDFLHQYALKVGDQAGCAVFVYLEALDIGGYSPNSAFEGVFNSFLEGLDFYNRKRILNLLLDHISLFKKMKFEYFARYFALWNKLLKRLPRLAFNLMEGMIAALKMESGEGQPTQSLLPYDLDASQEAQLIHFIEMTNGFIPTLYKAFLKEGDVLIENLRHEGRRILADEFNLEDAHRIIQEKGADYLLCLIQMVSPMSGASFIPKNEQLGLMLQMLEVGDLRKHIPEKLKDKVERFSVSQGVRALKLGEKTDETLIAYLTSLFAKEEGNKASAKDLKKALEKYLDSNRQETDQEEVLRILGRVISRDEALQERMVAAEGEAYLTLSLFEQFFYDPDGVRSLLDKALAEIPEEKFIDKSERRTAIRVESVEGLVRQILGIWNSSQEAERKQNAIASILRNIVFEDIEKHLLQRGDFPAELSQSIKEGIQKSRSLSKREVGTKLLQNILSRLQKEKTKFVLKETKEIPLALRFVRGPTYSLNGLTSGVCTAGDIKLWKNPNYHLMALMDESSSQVVGYLDMMEQEVDGKRHFILLGINPSVEFLAGINGQDLYRKLYDKVVNFAREGAYDAVYMPVNPNIHSNRSEIQAAIRKAAYKTRDITTVVWNSIPTPYSFFKVYELWIKPN